MSRRKKGRSVSGWIILDKPYDMGSTQAVAKVRWLFDAKKAGHAGTLDPLASGVLPIALGEATKTVPYVVDGNKSYRFTVRWGAATNTDDAEGEVIATSAERPSREAIEAMLPGFLGDIEQTPPRFSAIKIEGKRAYAEARAGREVELDARPVYVESLTLADAPTVDEAIFELTCGRGTYVRSLARDFGARLGCHGHVRNLRRTYVEPFEEGEAVSLETLIELEGDLQALDAHLLTPRQAMDGFVEIRVNDEEARRLRLGNPILLRGRDAPIHEPLACAIHRSQLVAIGDINAASFHPKRVLAG